MALIKIDKIPRPKFKIINPLGAIKEVGGNVVEEVKRIEPNVRNSKIGEGVRGAVNYVGENPIVLAPISPVAAGVGVTAQNIVGQQEVERQAAAAEAKASQDAADRSAQVAARRSRIRKGKLLQAGAYSGIWGTGGVGGGVGGAIRGEGTV